MEPALRELVDGDAGDQVAALVWLADPTRVPAGVTPVARFGDVVTARVLVDQLPSIDAADSVRSIRAVRRYPVPVDTSTGTGTDATETGGGNPGLTTPRPRPHGEATGRGVVMGVADWGLDIAHPAFRNADGTTRLLAFWDQTAPFDGNRYGYGAVRDRDAINAALREDDPYAAIGHHPADISASGTHGTHVLSIAAGSTDAGAAAGVAPETDLVFVHLGSTRATEPSTLGDSATLLEALDWMSAVAGDRPTVVSLSVGRHGGPHDGYTLVERGFEHWLARPGRVLVQSAGNYFETRTHASGRLLQGRPQSVDWVVKHGDRTPNEAEVYYPSRDRVQLRVIDPDGNRSPWVGLDERGTVTVDGVTTCRVYHRRLDSSGNHIDVFTRRGAPSGTWSIELRPESVTDGRFDIWVERDGAGRDQSELAGPLIDPFSSTGTIANAFNTIAVGAADTNGPVLRIAPFSSAGPLRDGRQKPELVAPGVDVVAARSVGPSGAGPSTVAKSGSSMAAPFVAGTAALLLQRLGAEATVTDVRAALFATATPIPDGDPRRQGAGLVDVEAALAHVATSPSKETEMSTEQIFPEPTIAEAVLAETAAAEHVENAPADPVVLAGPILRTTTPRAATIWIASSVQVDLIATAWDGATVVGASGGAGHEWVEVGPKLWINLVTITASGSGFPRNRVLTYDVRVRTGGDEGTMISALMPGLGLGDTTGPRPSFIISTGPLQLLHGSCRKTHGHGRDAMTAGLAKLRRTATSATGRPSALFLTGDQIYADDVDHQVRLHAAAIGRATAGVDGIPGMPDGDRTAAMSGLGFTAGDVADDHLTRFGEWCGLYLLAWNEQLWTGSLANSRHRAGVRDARVLLANIPTYMIFDDHEITDDWNLDRPQAAALAGNEAARQIIANGLAAYWLFQGWGNEPTAKAPRQFPRTVQWLASKTAAHGTAMRNELLGVAPGGRNAPLHTTRRHWSYVAPTSTPVIVLDTRTQRVLAGNGGPALQSPAQLRWLASRLGALAPFYQRGMPAILVSPAPLLGVEIMELAQRIVSSLDTPYAVDDEAWINSGRPFLDFLQTVFSGSQPYTVVLSGDVHFAMSMTADIRLRRAGTPAGRIVQLTSSPLKNQERKAADLAAAVADAARGESAGLVRLVQTMVDVPRANRVIAAAVRGLAPLLLELTKPHRHLVGWLADPRANRPDLRRPLNWLMTSFPPIVFPRSVATSFGFSLPTADWTEERLHHRTTKGNYIVSETNIGHVVIRRNGRVDHTLLTGPRRADGERVQIRGTGALPSESTLPRGGVRPVLTGARR